MRVLLITNLYSRPSVPIIKKLNQNGVLVGVVLFDNLRPKRGGRALANFNRRHMFNQFFRFLKGLWRRFIMFFFKDVVRLKPENAIELVMDCNILHIISKDLSDSKVLGQIKGLNPEVILLASLSCIIKKELLEIPTKGTLNIHPSILPFHRGPKPVFWTLLKGEKEFGFTIHQVTKEIDKGNILVREYVEVGNEKSESKINQLIFVAAGEVIVKCLTSFCSGKTQLINIEEKGSYEGCPSPLDLRSFQKMGFTY